MNEKELIERIIEKGVKYKKFLGKSQLDTFQGICTFYYSHGYLSDKQINYMKAIVSVGKLFYEPTSEEEVF